MSLDWVGEGTGCRISSQARAGCTSQAAAPLRLDGLPRSFGRGVESDRRASIHLMAGLAQKVKVKVKCTVASAENQPAS